MCRVAIILTLYKIHFAAILCDRLPSLKYGRIRLSYGYKWNSVATHSCNWGYQFKKDHGDVKRVCQEDGSWSGSPPLCIRKFHFFLPCLTSFCSFHAHKSLSCSTSFHSLPFILHLVYTAIDCGPLSAPDNGSVRVTSTRVGAIAKYACNEGFTLGGRKTRTCQKSGMWSGDAPTCKRHNHSYIK